VKVCRRPQTSDVNEAKCLSARAARSVCKKMATDEAFLNHGSLNRQRAEMPNLLWTFLCVFPSNWHESGIFFLCRANSAVMETKSPVKVTPPVAAASAVTQTPSKSEAKDDATLVITVQRSDMPELVLDILIRSRDACYRQSRKAASSVSCLFFLAVLFARLLSLRSCNKKQSRPPSVRGKRS
jgi:hypothetical protein